MKITIRAVDALKAKEKVVIYWDESLKGFGVKVTPAESKIYVVQYRMGGSGTPTRRFTLGKHGALTPDQARKRAVKILGDIANGIDPQDQKNKEKFAITISDLCDQYLKEGCSTKKPSTLLTR